MADLDQLTRDPLTGAVAPWLFEDRMALMAQRLRRSRRLGALLVIDVDRLAVVNDTLGRDAGDQLLRAIVERVQARLRNGDTLARTGDDELAVLVDELAGPDDAGTVAEAILEVLRLPFRLGSEIAMVSASIGVASIDGEEPVVELLRRADLALHRAKQRGGSRWAAFEGRTTHSVDRRLEIEWALRRRLDEGGVRFRYRPVVEVRTGTVAFIRSAPASEWHEVGMVHAPELRAVAASCGLADQLLLQEVASGAIAAATWPGHVPVAVVLPAEVLATGRAAQSIEGAWVRSGGRDGQLMVVLPDADGLDAEVGAHEVEALRSRGVRIALDLAGGAVSLRTLRTLPADVLELDGPLLTDLAADRTRAVVGAVLGVAEVLGAVVVAGGVDDEGLLAAARSLGVDLVHGDRIGRAMELAELEPWFSAASARG